MVSHFAGIIGAHPEITASCKGWLCITSSREHWRALASHPTHCSASVMLRSHLHEAFHTSEEVASSVCPYCACSICNTEYAHVQLHMYIVYKYAHTCMYMYVVCGALPHVYPSSAFFVLACTVRLQNGAF